MEFSDKGYAEYQRRWKAIKGNKSIMINENTYRGFWESVRYEEISKKENRSLTVEQLEAKVNDITINEAVRRSTQFITTESASNFKKKLNEIRSKAKELGLSKDDIKNLNLSSSTSIDEISRMKWKERNEKYGNIISKDYKNVKKRLMEEGKSERKAMDEAKKIISRNWYGSK